MDSQKTHAIRQEYTLGALDESDVSHNPIHQFTKWFEDALKYNVMEPNAMTLSTVSTLGQPSSRIVLLKEVDATGFHFFTNYNSRKGQELLMSPFASLLFFWPELQRQVRIEGSVQKLSEEASDFYFNSRPKESQMGAVASPQSQIIPNRILLEDAMVRLRKEYVDSVPIDRPAHWGGYKLIPHAIEFWQGRSSRLHDRLKYELEGEHWLLHRLAP